MRTVSDDKVFGFMTMEVDGTGRRGGIVSMRIEEFRPVPRGCTFQ